MGITLPGESAEYRAARERLLEREIELRRTMEPDWDEQLRLTRVR